MHPASQLIAHTPEGQLAITVDDQARGRRLTEWLRRADLPLNTRCGQRGLCDGCLVELVSGTLIRADSGQTLDASAGSQTLQACQYCPIPGTAAVIHVPARSLLAHRPQVVTSFRVDVSRAHDPLWQTIEIPAEEFAGAEDPIAAVCEVVRRRRGAAKTAPKIRKWVFRGGRPPTQTPNSHEFGYSSKMIKGTGHENGAPGFGRVSRGTATNAESIHAIPGAQSHFRASMHIFGASPIFGARRTW
jgi:ferredoxin